MSDNSIHKYDFIDALRGFAILGVVLIHVSQWIVPTSKTFQIVAADGALGVQLFFVASALTLFLSLDTRRANEAYPIRNFFIRRFFRIAPMFYLAILVFTLIYGFSARNFAPNGVRWWYILATATFMSGWHPETINSVVNGGWSIAVEMTFYLFVPMLFIYLKNIKRTVLFIAAALLLNWVLTTIVHTVLPPLYPQNQQYLIDSFTYFWFFTQLPIFGIGILVFHLFTRYRKIQDRNLGYILLVAAFFLMIAFLKTDTFQNLIQQTFLMAIGFAFLALGMYFSNTKVLVNPIITWIGKISFSVYLVHFIVLHFTRQIFPGDFPIQGNLGTIIGYFTILIPSLGISTLTYRFIEKPGMQLGKLVIQKLNQRAVRVYTNVNSE